MKPSARTPSATSFLGATLVALIAYGLAAPTLANNESDVIRLICSHHTSQVLPGGEPERVSGEDLVVATRAASGAARVERGHASLYGSVSPEEIVAEGDYTVGKTQIKELLIVNRYTGGFTRMLSSDGKGAYATSGKCRAATAPLF